MEHSHKFFCNNSCKYFPCHPMPESNDFNCMFCYCPLYVLNDKCGGDFKYSSTGVKTCIDCCLPHLREYYDTIVSKVRES